LKTTTFWLTARSINETNVAEFETGLVNRMMLKWKLEWWKECCWIGNGMWWKECCLNGSVL